MHAISMICDIPMFYTMQMLLHSTQLYMEVPIIIVTRCQCRTCEHNYISLESKKDMDISMLDTAYQDRTLSI